MSSGKVLLGVLAGVAAGATIGILFAPDKGDNTRRRISQKSDEYAEGLATRFGDFIENITNSFENMRRDAAEVAKRVKDRVEKTEQEAKSTAEAHVNNI